MALTIQQIAQDGFAHVLLADAGATADQTAYMVNSINLAIEEMRDLCPQVFRKTYDITWTAGAVQSVALTSNKTWAGTGAAGSTVSLPGDTLTFNELASATSLLFPYAGTSGTKPVTVYGDSVVLDGAVGRVLGCELLTERRPLGILNSRSEWMDVQGLPSRRDYYASDTVDETGRRAPGIPRWVWIETVVTAAGAIEQRARCAPLPSGTFRATLDVETISADVTAADVAAAAAFVTGALTPDATGVYTYIGLNDLGKPFYVRLGDDPFFISEQNDNWAIKNARGFYAWIGPALTFPPDGDYPPNVEAIGTATVTVGAASTTRPVPGARVYGILRALALYHWSGSPWFRNDASRAIIQKGYADAIQQLLGFRPNAGGVIRSVVGY